MNKKKKKKMRKKLEDSVHNENYHDDIQTCNIKIIYYIFKKTRFFSQVHISLT